MARDRLDVDKMLRDVDKGKGPSTLGQMPKFMRQYEKPAEPPKRPKKGAK